MKRALIRTALSASRFRIALRSLYHFSGLRKTKSIRSPVSDKNHDICVSTYYVSLTGRRLVDRKKSYGEKDTHRMIRSDKADGVI